MLEEKRMTTPQTPVAAGVGQPIIENMLYQGTYLLAGAPKIGKSFLVGQLAYRISTGTPFLGNRVRQDLCYI